MDTMPGCSYDSIKDLNSRISHSHSKKVIKHALRQQAKRRRKNTTIASGNSAPLPRIVVKSLPPQQEDKDFKDTSNSVSPKPATMREVLASIPGFSIKPRKRSNKKLSAAAQLEQTKEGCIDLETPDSILVNTNLRALLNKHTFSSLPPLYQYKLVQLLPDVDRAGVAGQPDVSLRLSTSGLNNEFFARACLEWRERLAEGEFTPENQQKLKAEAEKEMSRLDPWKLKHFEPIWGEKHEPATDTTPLLLSSPARPSLKTTIKLRPSTSASGRHSKIVPSLTRRLRTVGAVTRAITSYRVREEADSTAEETPTPAEKRPAEQTDENGEEKEVHKKLRPLPSPAAENLEETDAGTDATSRDMNVDECVLEDNAETEVTAAAEEEETAAAGEAATEEAVKDEAADITETETMVQEASNEDSDVWTELVKSEVNDEYKVDAEVSESAECEMKLVESSSDASVKDEENGSETGKTYFSNEHDKSEVIDVNCESNREFSESENKTMDNTDDDDDEVQTIESHTVSDVRPVVNDVDVSERSDVNAENRTDSEEWKDRDEADHDSSMVQEMAVVSDSDNMTYEPNAVPEHDVIHESAILDSTGFVLKGECAVQDNGNSKDCETKTAVEVSTEVGSMSDHEDSKADEEEDNEEVQAAALIAAVEAEECCWDVVDSTEKLLAEVPIVALEAVPVPVPVPVAVPVTLAVVEEGEAVEEVEVIPMQEELEVRLEEGTFPVAPDDALSMDWPYAMKMDSAIVAAALDDTGDGTSSTMKSAQAQYPEYSTSQAVKLELEVTLTPEAMTSADSLVTSTVGGSQHNTAASSAPPTVSKANVATVIPPTTIVCLPSAVSTPNLINHTQLSSCLNAPTSSNVVSSSLTKTAAVASSSAVPYLALSSNTPVRALPTQLPKSQTKAKPRDSSQVINSFIFIYLSE
ncbi:hypothetical protein ANN_20026 [Periplaneta americana]|uniref:DEUBAD domain-containing protein n=1 Tax=Periplaneta americana TaxID=6978 RepID=A0ABQ8SBH4_PERAM|nr:hypothetical protein ANN_20026 [Periplaneta americana]